tara:strand:- start:118867 stop:120252 length:1386 start_codon:yes stop_codon:yes gene_type:complete
MGPVRLPIKDAIDKHLPTFAQSHHPAIVNEHFLIPSKQWFRWHLHELALSECDLTTETPTFEETPEIGSRSEKQWTDFFSHLFASQIFLRQYKGALPDKSKLSGNPNANLHQLLEAIKLEETYLTKPLPGIPDDWPAYEKRKRGKQERSAPIIEELRANHLLTSSPFRLMFQHHLSQASVIAIEKNTRPGNHDVISLPRDLVQQPPGHDVLDAVSARRQKEADEGKTPYPVAPESYLPTALEQDPLVHTLRQQYIQPTPRLPLVLGVDNKYHPAYRRHDVSLLMELALSKPLTYESKKLIMLCIELGDLSALMLYGELLKYQTTAILTVLDGGETLLTCPWYLMPLWLKLNKTANASATGEIDIPAMKQELQTSLDLTLAMIDRHIETQASDNYKTFLNTKFMPRIHWWLKSVHPKKDDDRKSKLGFNAAMPDDELLRQLTPEFLDALLARFTSKDGKVYM